MEGSQGKHYKLFDGKGTLNEPYITDFYYF